VTCYIEQTSVGTIFLCGDFGPYCAAECYASTGFLCDYPVGDGKTCDLSLCGDHATLVAPNIHYCPGHFVLWQEFRDAGGVTAELQNVMPFRREDGL